MENKILKRLMKGRTKTISTRGEDKEGSEYAENEVHEKTTQGRMTQKRVAKRIGEVKDVVYQCKSR